MTVVYSERRHRTLRAPIKHPVGDRQSSAIYQLRSSARPTLASTRSHRHFGRKGFGVVVAAAASGRCAAGRGRSGPAWRWSAAWRRDVRWPSSIHPAFPRRPQSGRTADPAGRRGDCSLPAQLNPINLRHPSVSRNVRSSCRTQVPPASKLRQIYRVYFVINSRRSVVPMSKYTIHRGIFTGFFVRVTIPYCA